MQSRNDQGKASRDDRLKAALRENLRRRKAQARARRDESGPPSERDRPSDDGGEGR